MENEKLYELGVSVIIVSWNTRQITCDCLGSIYEQTQNIQFEVIVVDNASSDDSVVTIKRDYPEVILLENKKNLGFAAANNQGMTIAKGRYVLLLNSDTVVSDNAIAKTVAFADKHTEVAIVGCRVINPDMSLQPTCFMFPSILNMLLSSTYLYKLFAKNRFFGREQITWWSRDTVREVDVVTGCFMLVRREALEQVGMMDERFFVYGEETDWCYRFKQAGWKVMFTPDVEIIHLGGQSSKQVVSKMVLQLRGSLLLFFMKHRSRYEYRLACFLVLLFFIVRIPVWLIKWFVCSKNRANCLLFIKVYIVGVWKLISGGPQCLCEKSYKL